MGTKKIRIAGLPPEVKELTIKEEHRIKMEDFYYTALYDVLQEPGQHAAKMVKLKKLKAKIIRLNSSYRQRLLIDTSEQDRIAGEPSSLHQLIKTRNRPANRLIEQIVDDNNKIQKSSISLLRAFSMHFHREFKPITINEQSVRQLTRCGLRPVTPEVNMSLTDPTTLEELWNAVSKGKPHKAPGIDGICLEFYKSAWDVIKTELL